MQEIRIPEIFRPFQNPARYKVAYGGRGSGKSRSIARFLLLKRCQSRGLVLCTRELQKSIADSVHRLLSNQIKEMRLERFYEVQRERIIGANGSEFIFKGLRSNIEEIKSTEGINDCWVEEAQNVSEESWDNLIPTVREDGSEIWVSFNRKNKNDPTDKRFIQGKLPNEILIEANYWDNPFFPETLCKEMEWDRAHDYQKYLHIWEGQPVTRTDAQVFSGKWREDIFVAPSGIPRLIGVDWGFANDPIALVSMYIYDQTLFIEYEAGGVGIEIPDMPALFNMIPDIKKWNIIADNSRPELIRQMQRHGYKVLPTAKGKGSIEAGIAMMRAFREIVVHSRCKHVLDELQLYSYKIDRLTKQIMPIIEDANNHYIDAARYGLEQYTIAAHGNYTGAVVSLDEEAKY